jgi:hypothetical protein
MKLLRNLRGIQGRIPYVKSLFYRSHENLGEQNV